jgi:hypothetical protein
MSEPQEVVRCVDCGEFAMVFHARTVEEPGFRMVAYTGECSCGQRIIDWRMVGDPAAVKLYMRIIGR